MVPWESFYARQGPELALAFPNGKQYFSKCSAVLFRKGPADVSSTAISNRLVKVTAAIRKLNKSWEQAEMAS